jgi:hypothetical protein
MDDYIVNQDCKFCDGVGFCDCQCHAIDTEECEV